MRQAKTLKLITLLIILIKTAVTVIHCENEDTFGPNIKNNFLESGMDIAAYEEGPDRYFTSDENVISPEYEKEIDGRKSRCYPECMRL